PAGLRDGFWVQGIIWSEDHPLVVIEGDLFKQGDMVDQYTIKEIAHDGITVESGGTTQFIPLERGLDMPASDAATPSSAEQAPSSPTLDQPPAQQPSATPDQPPVPPSPTTS